MRDPLSNFRRAARQQHRRQNLFFFGAAIGGLIIFIVKVAIIVAIGYFVLNAFGVFDAKAEPLPEAVPHPPPSYTTAPCTRTISTYHSADPRCMTRLQVQQLKQERASRALNVLILMRGVNQ